MTYTTPAMLSAMKKAAYDSENGCTAEPSECTVDKARKHCYAERLASHLGLSIDDVVAPSAEDEFFAILDRKEAEGSEDEDYVFVPKDIISSYSGNLPQDDIYVALARGDEPADLGNACYGASPKLPEQKSEDTEKALRWKRDDKNAKLKKLRSKESIRQMAH